MINKIWGVCSTSFPFKAYSDIKELCYIAGVETRSVHVQYVQGRDTGNDFFVSQISGGSVTFPGTRIVG